MQRRSAAGSVESLLPFRFGNGARRFFDDAGLCRQRQLRRLAEFGFGGEPMLFGLAVRTSVGGPDFVGPVANPLGDRLVHVTHPVC